MTDSTKLYRAALCQLFAGGPTSRWQTGRTYTSLMSQTVMDEHRLFRESCVLVDILSVYDRLGVDVLGRIREFNKLKPHSQGRTA
jgi:hypothetical protein